MRALVRAQATGARRRSSGSPLPSTGTPPERRVDAASLHSRSRAGRARPDPARRNGGANTSPPGHTAPPPPSPLGHGHGHAHHAGHGHPHHGHHPAHLRALVLDATYRPIDVVPWTRAICLDLLEKVDVLEYYEGAAVRSATRSHPVPAVLRSRAVVAWGSSRGPAPALTRRNILARDGGRCAYCGKAGASTVDHVVPASLGGGRSWTNLVAACERCNQLKAARTLDQLGWKLRCQPRRPAAAEWAAAMAAARGAGGGPGGGGGGGGAASGRGRVGSTAALPPPEWSAYLATSQASLAAHSHHHASPGDAAAAA